jgi:Gly-Xaa carboxypeptidase
VVNYRIAPHDSIVTIKQHITDIVSPIAKQHNIAVRDFGQDLSKDDIAPFLALTSKDDLSPSPISPTGLDSKVWATFSGVLRQVFEDIETFKGKTVVPIGDIMTGNTDTIHYWNISRNIYRFSPAREGTRIGIHTVDERIDMNAHVEGMRVYYDLIREFDRADI